MDGLLRLLLIATGVLLPVPILLVSVTLAWAVLRRWERRSPDHA